MQYMSSVYKVDCTHLWPVPMDARSKAWDCGRSLAGIVVSSPAGDHRCLSVVSVVCYQVEVSALG